MIARGPLPRVRCSLCGALHNSRSTWGMRLVGTRLDVRCYRCLRAPDVEIAAGDVELWEKALKVDHPGTSERIKRLRYRHPRLPLV